ncbi:phage terminase small subunit [Blautia coccoides]|uniref:phage terminase small subunit n=1 Tax=Blautia producta TaxID=33035 RepID=UPI0028A333DD|nr:phage terminase small subunit [Blautia coccoides]MDT4377097.1 phage terminase small subunit [Blautia coccoides]
MARAPDARAEQAKELFLSGKKLIEISELMKIPEGTIRSWKNRYKWDNATLQKSKRNVAKKRGGQPGNRNAEGNKGGSAPKQNKNAVKTGEFETLFFDALEPEEMRLIGMVQPDKEQLLLQEIQLLTVRERRMLKRIDSLKSLEGLPGPVDTEDNKLPPGMSVVRGSTGYDKGKTIDIREYEGILGQIQTIEDALTRVQARRQRAIEALHKFGYDDARLELEAMKFELELTKQDGSGEEKEDDGFMEAMNATASDVWGDADV